MSSIGTGIAAGIAQTSHQAGEVAKKQDKQRVDRQRRSRKVQDVVETHLQAVEEGDEDSPAQLHIDEQLPEHVSPPAADTTSSADAPGDDDDPEYHHLDVRA